MVRSLNEKITIGILVVLVITSAVWVATSGYIGPLIALIVYTLIALDCWRGNFRVGIVGGIVVLGFVIFELIFSNIRELGVFNLGFFSTNPILLIPLIYFSYKAYQEVKRRKPT